MKDRHIFIKNIYYMLSYAFTTLRESSFEDVQKENFDNLNNLFAAILARGIGLQLKRGLYREYISKKEDLSVVRGKIDLQGTISNVINQRMLVSCEFDELSENNLLNQIIKSTVFLLLKQDDIKKKYKVELKKEMLFFSSVSQIDLKRVNFSKLYFRHNNRTYQLLIGICQLLIEGSLLTTQQGEYHLASFIDTQRMSRLYEKFILEYYKQEIEQKLPGFTSRARQIQWQLDDQESALLPTMQTDVTLTYQDQILIIDTKYYQQTLQSNFNVQTLHSQNLYQIFTYVKNKAAEVEKNGMKVSGMLLYAKTDEDIVPDYVYQMSGNQISVKTLDLNQEFSKIAGQLDKIICDNFHL